MNANHRRNLPVSLTPLPAMDVIGAALGRIANLTAIACLLIQVMRGTAADENRNDDARSSNVRLPAVAAVDAKRWPDNQGTEEHYADVVLEFDRGDDIIE